MTERRSLRSRALRVGLMNAVGLAGSLGTYALSEDILLALAALIIVDVVGTIIWRCLRHLFSRGVLLVSST